MNAKSPPLGDPKGHDRAVDYWSIGCLIFEMLFGGTPFYERGIDQKGLFKNIVRGKWRLPDNAGKLSQHAMDLIRGMLQKRPTERLGECKRSPRSATSVRAVERSDGPPTSRCPH